jgi:hypothetical protein
MAPLERHPIEQTTKRLLYDFENLLHFNQTTTLTHFDPMFVQIS